MQQFSEGQTPTEHLPYSRHEGGSTTSVAEPGLRAAWLESKQVISVKEEVDTPMTEAVRGFSPFVGTALADSSRSLDSLPKSPPAWAASSEEIPRDRRGPGQLAREKEAATRLELLVRSSVAKLTPEEDARLVLATERLRRLVPRVTSEDMNKLAEAAEKTMSSREARAALRSRLKLDH